MPIQKNIRSYNAMNRQLDNSVHPAVVRPSYLNRIDISIHLKFLLDFMQISW